MIKDRILQIVHQVVTSFRFALHQQVVWLNCTKLPLFWTNKGFGGVQVGPNCGQIQTKFGISVNGWQCCAFSVCDSSFRKTTAFAHFLTAPEVAILRQLFQVMLFERSAFPLPITSAVCEGCQEPILERSSLYTNREVRKRATPKKMFARVCREAGG